MKPETKNKILEFSDTMTLPLGLIFFWGMLGMGIYLLKWSVLESLLLGGAVALNYMLGCLILEIRHKFYSVDTILKHLLMLEMQRQFEAIEKNKKEVKKKWKCR